MERLANSQYIVRIEELMETLDRWAKTSSTSPSLFSGPYMVWEWFALRCQSPSKGKGAIRDQGQQRQHPRGLIKPRHAGPSAGYTGWLFVSSHEHRPFTLARLVESGAAVSRRRLYLYYWYHRSAHRCRLFWMEHVNHHSSEHYNLSTALRQSTPGPAYTFVHLPLVFVGFHPLAIAVQFGISLIYQYWIHTEAIDRPGFLEKFMNTPLASPRPPRQQRHLHRQELRWHPHYLGQAVRHLPEERRDVPVKYGLVHDLRPSACPP